ncbi:MAG: M20/M25/M40 family metallo-hydrolase, partial [Eubacteriales bacterium]|nr:M20/M25/M40 family metallo-hydrolase [Eubacteriales bacterium]
GYRNMREIIEQHMHLIENAKKAYAACGEEAVISPIRGGTDGATLSVNGLPCPNIGTGGHNCHGRYEYITAEGLDKMTEVILELVKIYSE